MYYDEHRFKFKILAGPTGSQLNARLLYEFSKEVIWRTVPGALRGGDGELMGARTQNAVTTAVFGGQVRTTHDDKKMTMRNYAEPGHVFSEGFLDIEFIDKDGNTYIILEGGGKNNFSTVNQIFGSWVFPNMGRANIEAYREFYKLPQIKNTVEDITDKE
jgi:subtilisin family serine protease